MLCFDCNKKAVCKHYESVNANFDIEMDIKKCRHYSTELSETTFKAINTDTTPIKEPLRTVHYPPYGNPYPFGGSSGDSIKRRIYDTSSSTKVDDIKVTYNDFKATPVKVSKVVCSKCNKEVLYTQAQNCIDCGDLTCYDCGYTTVNSNTGDQSITCDKCFNGEADNQLEAENSLNLDEAVWDISSFEDKEDVTQIESEKEELTDAKKTSRTRRISNKPKKE